MRGREACPTEESRRKSSARRNYNRIAPIYDLLTFRGERRSAKTGLGLLAVRPGERVLEVGFGTGWSLVQLARAAGKTGRVVGIDLSDAMVRIAARRIRRAGLNERVEITRGDAVCFPLGTDVYDAIFMSFTVELFDRTIILRLLEKCARALRRDGRIVIVSLSKRRSRSVRIYEWFHRIAPTLIDCRPIHLTEILKESGFDVIEESHDTLWSLPVSAVRARPRRPQIRMGDGRETPPH